MKTLLVGTNLFIGSVVGVVLLLEGLGHFYAGIYNQIGQALLTVTANLAGR